MLVLTCPFIQNPSFMDNLPLHLIPNPPLYKYPHPQIPHPQNLIHSFSRKKNQSIPMASISSSFHSLSSSSPSMTRSTHSFLPPVTPIRFRKSTKPRPISAVCAAAPPTIERSGTASLYDLLGVHAEASCQEIKTAYRRLARVLHPDVASAANGGQNGVASGSEFIRVHEAYATLSDPGKRADYDRALSVRRRLMKGSAPGSFTGRARASPTVSRFTKSWETDQCW